MPCGLVRAPRADLDAWAAAVDKGESGPRTIRTAVFTDGIALSPRSTPFQPHVTKAPDGRIWFASTDGVNIIDPRRLPKNPLAPPVHVERMIADRRAYPATANVGLPPRIRDLEIDYTALSLVAPEKNRFRIRLEGRDREWQDVGTRRQAFYTTSVPARTASASLPATTAASGTTRERHSTSRLRRRTPDAVVSGTRRHSDDHAVVGGLSTADPPGRTSVQPDVGRTGQRANAHRARPARHDVQSSRARCCDFSRPRTSSRRAPTKPVSGSNARSTRRRRRSPKAVMRCRGCDRRRRR